MDRPDLLIVTNHNYPKFNGILYGLALSEAKREKGFVCNMDFLKLADRLFISDVTEIHDTLRGVCMLEMVEDAAACGLHVYSRYRDENPLFEAFLRQKGGEYVHSGRQEGSTRTAARQDAMRKAIREFPLSRGVLLMEPEKYSLLDDIRKNRWTTETLEQFDIVIPQRGLASFGMSYPGIQLMTELVTNYTLNTALKRQGLMPDGQKASFDFMFGTRIVMPRAYGLFLRPMESRGGVYNPMPNQYIHLMNPPIDALRYNRERAEGSDGFRVGTVRSMYTHPVRQTLGEIRHADEEYDGKRINQAFSVAIDGQIAMGIEEGKAIETAENMIQSVIGEALETGPKEWFETHHEECGVHGETLPFVHSPERPYERRRV